MTEQIKVLQNKVAEISAKTGISRQLQTMPSVGPIGALAIEAFAPPMEQFRRGRDFAAWLGLVPRQYSSGGKQALGKVTKMGQRDIRRLLITGAMAVIVACKRFGKHQGTWVARMLEKKPPMLVAVALANKMARRIWAMITKGQDYQEPVAKVKA
jgi:transposase